MRLLVEELGFRAFALEYQWTTGPQVNEYIRTGIGDLNTIVNQLGGQWSLGPDETTAMPPTAADWFEQPFARAHLHQFVLDLRRSAPTSVRRWLAAPAKTRGLAHAGPDSYMDGGSRGQWFDMIVHRQEITPAA